MINRSQVEDVCRLVATSGDFGISIQFARLVPQIESQSPFVGPDLTANKKSRPVDSSSYFNALTIYWTNNKNFCLN